MDGKKYQSIVRFVKSPNPVNKSIDIIRKSFIKVEGKFLVLLKKTHYEIRANGREVQLHGGEYVLIRAEWRRKGGD
jgi:hypothetical protein